MKISQLLIGLFSRIALAIIIFPLLPNIVYGDLGDDIEFSNTVQVFAIIYTAAVVSILFFESIFVGRKAKYEVKFLSFAVFFLIVIFYKSFTLMTPLAIVNLIIADTLFILRIPIRRYFESKNQKDEVV